MRSMTPTSGTSPAPVLALDDMTSRDPSLAGANAAALATARAAGLPVLDGLVIPVDVAAQVAGAGNGEALPEAVEPALRSAWCDLTEGGRSLVARSSSPHEDGSTSSMAGQFESVLDVRTWGELLAAVRAVVASADGGPMAVLVQPFVVPAWGGVMFGADPVSGRTDRLVVSAVPGGPHRLVSGKVDGTQMTLSPHRHTRARTLSRLEHRLDASERRSAGLAARAERADPAVLDRVREGAPVPPEPFASLTKRPNDMSVYVPVLLGAGVVFSALPWVVERVARVAARPAAKRSLARKLDTLALPPGGLLPPAEQPPDLFSPLRPLRR